MRTVQFTRRELLLCKKTFNLQGEFGVLGVDWVEWVMDEVENLLRSSWGFIRVSDKELSYFALGIWRLRTAGLMHFALARTWLCESRTMVCKMGRKYPSFVLCGGIRMACTTLTNRPCRLIS